MRRIKNARGVALKTFSMWANYLGLAVLIVPEVRFWLTGADTNPQLVWFAGVGLIVAGTIGRLIDQGIQDA